MKTSGRGLPQSTDWVATATAYAEEVTADRKRLRHGKWEQQACRRFLTDLKNQKKRKCEFYMDADHAGRICKFISMLPHIEGVWKSKTITLEPAQVFILVNLNGWRRKKDGWRRFNTAYIEVGRKNAKSALASGIGLFFLTADGEVGPQVKCAATTGDQAKVVFDVCRKMANKIPKMREAFKLQVFKKSIISLANGGSMTPINAKASTQDGLNPHLAILDELHAHKTRELYDVLRSARGARKSPLTLIITTAGYNTNGVCYEQHQLVRKVLDGIISADHYFGIIYSIDENDDPLDENVWRKANPLYGVSVNIDELRNYAKEARFSPETMAEFKTKRLNVWTSAKNGFINITRWQKCNAQFDLEEMRDVPAYAGLDLASTSDLCSFRLVWNVDGVVRTWGKRYLPESAVDPRTERNGLPYRTWVEQGHITLTPGDVTDYAFIERDIMEALDRFNITAIAYDSWNASDLCNRLVENGAPMVEFRQGPKSYHPAMQELERLYLSKKLEHAADPVLTWNASNLVARRDANNNMAPDKQKSFEKIDDIVALLMGLGVMISGQTSEGPSVYEERGIIEIEI